MLPWRLCVSLCNTSVARLSMRLSPNAPEKSGKEFMSSAIGQRTVFFSMLNQRCVHAVALSGEGAVSLLHHYRWRGVGGEAAFH